MPANSAVISKIDNVISKYEDLQKKYGLPVKGAIFDCLKIAQEADGSIPGDIEIYL